MNILNELTVKNLKRNKKRTIVTTFGIILSVALITAITTFISSMQGSMVDYAKKNEGNYHLLISDVPADQQKYLLNHAKAEKVMVGKTLGYAAPEQFFSEEYLKGDSEEGVEESTDKNEDIIKVRALEEEALREMGIRLTEGRLPQNENEILFPITLEGVNGVTHSVGEKLTLEIEGISKEYTITGYAYMSAFQFWTKEDKWGYAFITRLDERIEGEEMDIALLMEEPADAYPLYEELVQEKGFAKEQIMTNDTLLRFQGSMKSESTMQILYSMAAVVILIIVMTSIFVIKNSFDISITERMRQYGMLASVGATSRQIRKNVLFEGFLLGVFGIPLGILCGIFAIKVTLMVVMQILTNTSLAEEITLTMYVSWMAVAAAILIAVVIIYISALLPARKAAKIAPMEAIRDVNTFKVKAKKLKTPKILQKLLGVEGEIADKNLKRSRKKYRTTVFSIFLSIVLFISISSAIKYGFLLQSYQYEELDYNLNGYVESVEGELDEESEEKVYEAAAKAEGIKEYSIVKREIYDFVDGDYTKEMLKAVEEAGEEPDEGRVIEIYSVSEDKYREYLKEIGVSYDEAKEKAILIDTQRQEYYDKNGNLKRAQFHMLNSDKGDFLSYKTMEWEEEETGKIESGKIEIAGRTDKVPFGVRQDCSYYGTVVAIVSEEKMAEFDPGSCKIDGIYIEADDTKKVREQMETADESVIWGFNDYEAEARENNSIILIISIFLYGFIAVISVIGITNIFNTITTNMALRSREFAILKSVGMTDKEFRKMIRYESLLYGGKALLFGIPAGVGLSYLLYRQFIGLVEVAYEIPWTQIGIAIGAVFLVIFLTMGYSVRKTKKQNIIETIRSENI